MSQSHQEKPTEKPKIKTVEQISAGGVVFRYHNEQIQIAIVSVGASRRWQLPKGIIDAGETPEAAAVREVREEAGVNAEIVSLIEKIEYWYFGVEAGERVRFHKFVYFYLMKYTSGDPADHDLEVNEARFAKTAEALKLLTFEGEKAVVRKASELLK